MPHVQASPKREDVPPKIGRRGSKGANVPPQSKVTTSTTSSKQDHPSNEQTARRNGPRATCVACGSSKGGRLIQK
jgi:hypothetical protein